MSRLPDLEAWALFAHVVEAGSFAKAADICGVSQPTVSKAIGRLEARLGTQLLRRTPRAFSLTAAGELALQKARLVLHVGEEAEFEVSAEAKSLCGRVRVAAPVSFGIRHVAPLVPEFLRHHPKIEVELCLSDASVDLFLGDIDIAVRIGTLCDSSLRSRKLGNIARRLVAAPDYLAAHGRPQHPQDLGGHECLILSDRHNTEMWRLGNHAGQGLSVSVSGRFRSDVAAALAQVAIAAQGIALLPEFLVKEDIEAGRLECVLPGWWPEDTALNLVLPPGKLRPMRVAAFAEYLGGKLTIPSAAGRRENNADAASHLQLSAAEL